ncbi:sigma factor regulatory protein, FecR/PupR family [Hyphomonas neptunium ATCC 15444]|uniref:Sigma factor regulatory protein, FecR/PupR family n=2 Tax=Hyphomonas TaxID=85 RepID=Q0C5P1_HYPNA|nr:MULTISPECIES: FecR domain-containing protein [Hyphomonas]ABI78631.1 sigma factor regulatory protein, FecR/PupR family [Hyphomonas neptunium ATCC 15444]KCZ95380.1 sigma factor regulatory protein FecR/PupR family [Hyphomonas hirschiana VP5]
MKQDNGKGDRIDAAARSWAVYLHSGDAKPDKIAEFDAWLAADAAHVHAFRRYEKLMSDLVLIPELGEVGLFEGTRAAPGVIAAKVPRRSSQRVAAFVMMIALVGGGITVFGAGRTFQDASPAMVPGYETTIAEIRDVQLADGSVVTLGARSRIEPTFTDKMRIVKLYEGEAFFDVAPDPARPFYVEAGDRLIRVVGTRFDVRQGPETVRIAVVEGVVEVLQADNPRKAEAAREGIAKDVLRAGDEVVARIGSGEKTIGEIEPAEAAPWRRGWLTYENASLGEIVADANRYSPRQIVFEGEGIADLRMTAAFSVEKIDQFILGLEVTYDLYADYSEPDRVRLSRP